MCKHNPIAIDWQIIEKSMQFFTEFRIWINIPNFGLKSVFSKEAPPLINLKYLTFATPFQKSGNVTLCILVNFTTNIQIH